MALELFPSARGALDRHSSRRAILRSGVIGLITGSWACSGSSRLRLEDGALEVVTGVVGVLGWLVLVLLLASLLLLLLLLLALLLLLLC